MAASSILAAEKSKKQRLTEDQIRQTLTRIIVPVADFHDTSLKEAVSFLNAEIRRRSPHDRQIPVLLDIDPPYGPRAQLERGDPTFANVEPDSSPADTTFTVSLHEIPVLELIKYVTGLCNTQFRIQAGGVHIVDLGDPGPMVTRHLRIPADFFPSFQREDELCHTAHVAEMKKNFFGYLYPPGSAYPWGTKIILDSDATHVTVRSTEDQLANIQKLLDADRPASAFPIPGPNITKVIEGGPREGACDWRNAETDIAKKLRTIRLPKVDLQNVSLVQAGVLLTKLSAQFDYDSPRTKRGVSISAWISTESPGWPPRISYSATDVSLLDAARAIAKLCNYHVEINERGVRLRPSVFTTPGERTYLIPPSTAAQLAKWPEFINQDTPVAWMKESGVNLLPNGNSRYISKRHHLIVNGGEQVQKAIEQANEKAWRDYYASQKATTSKAD